MIRSQGWWIFCAFVIAVAGYAVGSGWLRIGPPEGVPRPLYLSKTERIPTLPDPIHDPAVTPASGVDLAVPLAAAVLGQDSTVIDATTHTVTISYTDTPNRFHALPANGTIRLAAPPTIRVTVNKVGMNPSQVNDATVQLVRAGSGTPITDATPTTTGEYDLSVTDTGEYTLTVSVGMNTIVSSHKFTLDSTAELQISGVTVEEKLGSNTYNRGDLGGSAVTLVCKEQFTVSGRATSSRSGSFIVSMDGRDFASTSLQGSAPSFSGDFTVKRVTAELKGASQDVLVRPTSGWISLAPVKVHTIKPPSGLVSAPTLLGMANSKHISFNAVGGVNIYQGYLRLKGSSPPKALTVYAFRLTASNAYETQGVLSVPFGVAEDKQTWSAEFNIPTTVASSATTLTDGQVIVVATDEKGNHQVSDPLTFVNSQTAMTNSAPPIDTVGGIKASAPGVFFINARKVSVVGEVTSPPGDAIVVIFDAKNEVRGVSKVNDVGGKRTYSAPIEVPEGERQSFRAAYFRGDQPNSSSTPFDVLARTSELKVIDWEPKNFGLAAGQNKLKIKFDPNQPYMRATDDTKEKARYKMFGSGGTGRFDLLAGQTASETITNAEFIANENAVVLTFQDLDPDIYQLTISAKTLTNSDGVSDIFGNSLDGDNGPGTDKRIVTTKPENTGARAAQEPSPGPFVPYQEYTKPRKLPTGFNPSDKVETRVSRLYYFRDAHRVAQIINRNLKSYNYAAVKEAERVAQSARDEANKLTDERRKNEREAIEKARLTREAEAKLEDATAALSQARADAARAGQVAAQTKAARDNAERVSTPQTTEEVKEEVARLRSELNELQAKRLKYSLGSPDRAEVEAEIARRLTSIGEYEQLTSSPFLELTAERAAAEFDAARAKVADLQREVTRLEGEVANLRAAEVAANEKTLETEAKEDRARETQFRTEVAAAHEDPDSYAPGKPESDDPVEQTSVSVIGEGVIQFRGPLKGINICRTMLNQIDAPVGQVRIGVHTIQINGERGKRMERVAAEIQEYVDHSRFLSMQSAQMLRKAVVTVASRMADQASAECVGRSQADRDKRYLHAFFGRDFVDELHAIDSEFLDTGNKLLSLHSMDTTSLASSLFLIALAGNETRRQILEEFMAQVQGELPPSEMRYLESAGPRGKHACNGKHCGGKLCCKDKLCVSACNARFESLMGVLNYPVAGPDTMTPIQREFIRLAQIFKSRLVTEMELRQRVQERALIEDRGNLDDPIEEQKKLKKAEDDAEDALEKAAKTRSDVRQKMLAAILALNTEFVAFASKGEDNTKTLSALSDLKNKLDVPASENQIADKIDEILSWKQQYIIDSDGLEKLKETGEKLRSPSANLDAARNIIEEVEQSTAERHPKTSIAADRDAANKTQAALDVAKKLQRLLLEPELDILQVAEAFNEFESMVSKLPNLPDDTKNQLNEARRTFKETINANGAVTAAHEELDRKRRSVDHKKLLDMLVDEVEDKYIELLEGTRAHIANIDGYIKLVATALDDDFNTQFYYPTFRCIREASQYWDVQVGKVETTNVLANNRGFAKVEPQATMEFDLPKRDILIKEAMEGSLTLVQEYGALIQDPNFLALVKMSSGLPTSSPGPGSADGLALVRNVLPTLPRQPDAQLLTQDGPGTGGPQFGAALEGLIPDPAVYKFENGTGFEIRPVVQPDGQSVVYHLFYQYTTNIREPIRPDEKHLGRVKRHFIDTDVQLSNYELREVSRYQVALKAARTSRGVPLLEDVPAVGALFRPLPSDESSLQQNIILSQATIFPTLFDLMGLRWAPAVADLDPLRLVNDEFIVRGRHRELSNRVFDISSSRVDQALEIPPAERRGDLYRSQETIPHTHPNGYQGPGMNLRDGHLREGYDPTERYPQSRSTPSEDDEGNGPFPRKDEMEVEGEGILIYPETPEPQRQTQPNKSSSSEIPAGEYPIPEVNNESGLLGPHSLNHPRPLDRPQGWRSPVKSPMRATSTTSRIDPAVRPAGYSVPSVVCKSSPATNWTPATSANPANVDPKTAYPAFSPKTGLMGRDPHKASKPKNLPVFYEVRKEGR